jgi:hypothetical protein
MKTSPYSDFTGSALDGRYDATLLKRLGRELSTVYGDTLEASLPPQLQSLVERLHQVEAPAHAGFPQAGKTCGF